MRNNLTSLRSEAKEVIKAIDAIHGPIRWPEICLDEAHLPPKCRVEKPQFDGAYHILLDNGVDAWKKRASLSHAVGHIIAAHVFGFGTKNWWRDDAASDTVPASILAVEQVIEHDDGIGELKSVVRRQQSHIRNLEEESRHACGPRRAELKTAKMVLTGCLEIGLDELFARAYTQYVPHHGPNASLLEDIQVALDADPSRISTGLWTWHYFEQVAAALNAVFRERGLLQ